MWKSGSLSHEFDLIKDMYSNILISAASGKDVLKENDWEPRLGNCRCLHLAHLSVLIRKRDCEQQRWFSLAIISQHPGHWEVQEINKGINCVLSQTLTSGLNCRMETKFKDHGQTNTWLIVSWFWVLVLSCFKWHN